MYKKLMRGDGLFTFLRSIVASQISSWCDFGTGTLLVALHMSSWAATPIGCVVGGVINCLINYKFTFRASGCSKRAVGVKFFLVWAGSLILNTVGTSFLAQALDHWHLLETLGFTTVGSYATARIIVSMPVSFFWNYLLLKNFVYCPTRFDPHAIRFVDTINPGKKRHRSRHDRRRRDRRMRKRARKR